jgi:hypothetical protein
MQVGLRNCGGPVPPPIKYIYNEYDADENIIKSDTLAGNTNLLLTKPGNYELIPINAITGEVLGSFDVEVNASDLKLPFNRPKLSIGQMYVTANPAGIKCEYEITIHTQILNREKEEFLKYDFDFLSVNAGITATVTRDTLRDIGSNRWEYQKRVKITIDCNINPTSASSVIFRTSLKGEHNPFGNNALALCDTLIQLAPCCSSESCEDCGISLTVFPYEEPPNWHNDFVYRREIEVSSDCPGRTISKITHRFYSNGMVDSYNVNNQNSTIFSVTPPCTGDSATARYYVCATLSDGSICCKMVDFRYRCNRFFIDGGGGGVYGCCIVFASPVEFSGIASIRVRLKDYFPHILTVSIIDQTGSLVMPPVFQGPANWLDHTFEVDLNMLPSGPYQAVFQMLDEIISVNFIKQ